MFKFIGSNGGDCPCEDILLQILDKLGNLNFEGIIGTPDLDKIKGGTITLDGTKQIVIPPGEAITDKTYAREIWITNTTDQPLLIFVGNSTVPITLMPGASLKEQFNKQTVYIQGEIGATVDVIVRSNFTINFEIGLDEMPTPLGLQLLIGTGANRDDFLAPYYDNSTSAFVDNMTTFLDSEQGLTGWKAVFLTSFAPKTEYEFSVTVEGSAYDLTAPLNFQWISLPRILKFVATVASDIINPEDNNIQRSIVGEFTKDGYEGMVSAGKIKLHPNFLNLFGRFVAKSTSTGQYDTAIIKSYVANVDPYTGGTFTLSGF
ncbi:MAG: hypothetical protein ACRC8A_13285 [Microcoleaceae cyanobacterium]